MQRPQAASDDKDSVHFGFPTEVREWLLGQNGEMCVKQRMNRKKVQLFSKRCGGQNQCPVVRYVASTLECRVVGSRCIHATVAETVSCKKGHNNNKLIIKTNCLGK